MSSIVTGPDVASRSPQRLSFLVGHHVEQHAIRLAGVEQRHDVRMAELRDDAISCRNCSRPNVAVISGSSTFTATLRAMPDVAREVHRCHATATELPRDQVSLGQRFGDRRRRRLEERREALGRRATQQRQVRLAFRDQLRESCSAIGITARELRDHRASPVARRVEDDVDQRFELTPVVGGEWSGHGGSGVGTLTSPASAEAACGPSPSRAARSER